MLDRDIKKSKTKLSAIQISQWAEVTENGEILVPSGVRPIQMCNSDGTGSPLLKDGLFGADIIRFPPKGGVMNHVHEGAHILIVIKGSGYVEYNGTDYELQPGVCYLIPGNVDHAIKASSELVMIAVGNDHRLLSSQDRMQPIINE